MWGASMSMSLGHALGAKKNAEKTSSSRSAKYIKNVMSVPKNFTTVANQITNFMKENFLKDETTTQTPSIQKRTMQADTCCLNDYMIAAIIDQVSPFYIVYSHVVANENHFQVGTEPQRVVATLTRQLGRSIRKSEWPILQEYYIEHQPTSIVALVNHRRIIRGASDSVVTELGQL